MTKAYIFPGQGAQFVGMGKDFYETFSSAKDVYEEADEILGYKISKMCFEGPKESLMQTVNSQPAIFITSWAIFQSIKEAGVDITLDKNTALAGLSLGEFTAYTASGVWSFSDGLKLVQKRAELMQKAAESTNGTMASVLNLDEGVINEICQNVDGIVQSANYNSRSQIVISGEAKAVEEASSKLVEAGARKVIGLDVSGAFHSPLMQSAELGLKEALDHIALNESEIKVTSNVTAKPVVELIDVKGTLVKQLTSPVKWYHSMENLIENGYTEFVEFGPGKVLAGLMKRINKEVIVNTINEVNDIKKLK